MQKIFELKDNHWQIDAITLNTVTDNHDDVVSVKTVYVFKNFSAEVSGNIFIFRGLKETRSIITFSADYQIPTLFVKEMGVYFKEDDFEYVCIDGDENAVRRYLMRYAPEKLIAMSNTWGDCNGFSRVNSHFVKREIDASAKIGLDAAQIDDGWQRGKTNDRSIFDERGMRRFEGDFWEVDENTFPQGLEEMRDYAKTKNISLGLWFAPDFHENFAHYERDLGVLRNAFEKEDFRFFKIDMLLIKNREDKNKFAQFLEEVGSFASVELDVTNNQRMGYLLSMKYGIIFLENRYTKTGNYQPCRTLKNLWELSRYIPASTLQCELANPDLNKEVYGDDPLRPSAYTMDYLFATVMLSNPLFWMETQFLSEERIKELNNLLPLWKELRNEIVKAEIVPIGQKPTGASFTGFKIGDKYALLFREDNEEDGFDFKIGEFTVLKSNFEVAYKENKAVFSEKNCYAFVKIGEKNED